MSDVLPPVTSLGPLEDMSKGSSTPVVPRSSSTIAAPAKAVSVSVPPITPLKTASNSFSIPNQAGADPSASNGGTTSAAVNKLYRSQPLEDPRSSLDSSKPSFASSSKYSHGDREREREKERHKSTKEKEATETVSYNIILLIQEIS